MHINLVSPSCNGDAHQISEGPVERGVFMGVREVRRERGEERKARRVREGGIYIHYQLLFMNLFISSVLQLFLTYSLLYF